jgi:hypothetical protein
MKRVVIQQIDLVHVQDAPVGCGENARLEAPLALLDGALDIQRAHDTVLRRADGEVHEAGTPACPRQCLSCLTSLEALGAPRRWLIGVTAKGAIGDHFDLGQQRGQRTGSGRFCRAALAPDEHTADLGMNGIQYQSAFHALLPNDSSKRESKWHSHQPRSPLYRNHGESEAPHRHAPRKSSAGGFMAGYSSSNFSTW